jgi:hypothetical protein
MMSEVLIEYDTVLAADDGSRWIARACSRPGPGTVWEGWIEFVPLDPGSRPARSRRETTQPSREQVMYWATGLTPRYLTGALERTLVTPFRRRISRRVEPLFDGPAPEAEPAPRPAGPHPILDPFDVYAQGEDLLIRQLEALDPPRLQDIVVAYEIGGVPDVRMATRSELNAAILAAARGAAARGSGTTS